MTIAVDMGRKATKTNKQTNNNIILKPINLYNVYEELTIVKPIKIFKKNPYNIILKPINLYNVYEKLTIVKPIIKLRLSNIIQ